MPPVHRTFAGPVTARNALGVAARTLGGVFDVPTDFKEYGAAAPNPFPFNVAPDAPTTVDLAVVNLPAYTLDQGSVFRMRFAGSIVWGPGSQPVRINLLIGGGSPVVIAGGSSPVGTLEYFSGEVELIALDAPSASSRVGVYVLGTDFGGIGAIAPTFSTVQDAGAGIKLLDTGGCPTGIDITIRAQQQASPAGPPPDPANAVNRVSLYMLSADLLS